MFSQGLGGASAYARVGVETGVSGADPHRLILMLYQGAREAISQARMHLQQGNVPQRGEAIGKAIRIIAAGLQASLNKEVGGDIAARLDALYGYMTRRLLQANIEQSDEMLAEVNGLLATLEEAWAGIRAEAVKITSQRLAEGQR
jgi:flagellar protein FliS